MKTFNIKKQFIFKRASIFALGLLLTCFYAIESSAQTTLSDVLTYSTFDDDIKATRDTRFFEDVRVDGDLTLKGTSFSWEGTGGTPSVQFAKSTNKLSFNLKWTSNSNYQGYLDITNEFWGNSNYPSHIQNIGIKTTKNVLAQGLLVQDFVMIGAQSGFTKISGAALQVDGRVYISETGGSEEGWSDYTSSNYNDYLLWVEEGIVSPDYAISETSDWPDYVFDESYELYSLEEVESHIAEKGHLHTMPSAEEVEANGYSLDDLSKRMVQTIEELTLHAIDQEKRIQAQNVIIEELMAQFEAFSSK